MNNFKNIPFFDLTKQYTSIKKEILAAVESVFDRQAFILGTEVEKFETELAQYCQVKYAIGCASGSDALLLALMALEIKSEDEVITTPYTFFASGGSIARLGAKPVFVDIEPDTYNLNPLLLEEKITSRTRAIMPVHLFGQCADIDKIVEIAERHNIPVIEDAAQAIGARWNAKQAGTIGDIGCFSFYPTKNLGGAGDGGAIVTNNKELATKLRSLRVHGETSKYFHHYIGINSRLDTIQAVVLQIKLKYLDQWSAARITNSENYNHFFTKSILLSELIQIPAVEPESYHIFNQYVIRASNRNELRAYLKEQNIGTEIYYPLALHQQKCFDYLKYKQGDFPESERAAKETLALPIYPEMKPEIIRYIVDKINEFYKQYSA